MRFNNKYWKDIYMLEWFKLYKKSIQKLNVFNCNGTLPYRSFSPQVVGFIFKLADNFSMDNAVKYKCIELYDRFLSEYFIHKYIEVYNNYPNKWQKVLKHCKRQCYLQVISCIQLISKYTGQPLSLKLKDIKIMLKKAGYTYTEKEIISSEAKVFHIVGYKLSEPTIFMMVEFFIDIIPFHITESLYSTCLLLTDFVYIHQQELYDHLQYQKTGYRNYTYCEKLDLLDIEYDKISTAAAVIVTAFYILNSNNKKNKDICEYLSAFCEKSIDNILMISTALVFIINSI